MEIKQVTTSPIEEFFSYNWVDPPIVTFKARDGAEVPARLYKPAKWQPGGPAVLFVHGAGYLITAPPPVTGAIGGRAFTATWAARI